MTLAKDTEMAEERNRNTGMRWVTAARPTRMASMSGSTVSILSVCVASVTDIAPSATTVSTNVHSRVISPSPFPIRHPPR